MILKRSRLSYVIFGLVGILFLSGVILSHSISSTYAHENTLNINIAGACTLSTGGGNYSVSMVDGSTEINANNITTSCNDTSGYAIYAVGYSGDSDTGNNTDLINTANSTYNIKTDGSSDTGSNWKLKFTVVSDATIAGSYNTYQNIPSTYTKVASYTNSTASGIITPHYQINLVGIQQPGTYVGRVKYVLVHPNTMSPTYTINYNANGGSGTMTSSAPSSFESFTLPTSTLTTPTGYAFKNWCTVQDQTQNPQTTCTGNTYTDGETILAGNISTGETLQLYAIWELVPIYMQDMTLADCSTEGVEVYDKRDEKTYTVKKINDQCWMTQNLRYLGDAGSAAKTMTIGNNNSNVANKSITLYSLDSSNAGSFNAYSSSYCDTTNSYNYACVYDSGNTSTGVWYNFYAASAGTISGSSNSTAATSDICPAGWHLPSGPNTTANTDYNKLVGNTTNGWQATSGLTAFSAVAGGNYYNGSLHTTGRGNLWSATAGSTTYRYILYYNSSNGQFHGSSSSDRCLGIFVRCVRSS